jgi:hypothetical protein
MRSAFPAHIERSANPSGASPRHHFFFTPSLRLFGAKENWCGVCHSLVALYIFFYPRKCYSGTLLLFYSIPSTTLTSPFAHEYPQPSRCEWIDLPPTSEPFIGLHVL